MAHDPTPKLDIDWLKTAGGAFAAVSSAFLLSTFGAAGTIIGAALGSVIVTVGGAFYTQALARSHQRLTQVQLAAMRKVGVAQAEVRRAARNQDEEAVEAHLAHAEERLGEARDDLDAVAEEAPGPTWRELVVLLPWRRIALVAAGLFAAAVLVITAFELVAGESVSSITGGSEDGDGPTIGRIVGGSGEDSSPDDPSPDDRVTPSESPTEEPPVQETPTDVPTDDPSVAPSPTSTVPPAEPAPSETTPTTETGTATPAG